MIDLTIGRKMKVWCREDYFLLFTGDQVFEKGEECELKIAGYNLNYIRCIISNKDKSNKIGFAFTKHGLYDPLRTPLYTDYFYDIYTHRNSEIDKILSEEDK